MEAPGNKLPAGVSLGPLSRAVFDVLARYTAFPWPVLSAQCKRAGCVAETLSLPELRGLIPALGASVGRFTSPEKEQAVCRELETLAARPELRPQARKPG